jgi:CubicO group peptidase (beta-lactamase class C family)
VTAARGLIVAVIDGYEVARVEASGLSPDAPLQAGSLSKPVAALVALRLVEQGVVELDRDVDESGGAYLVVQVLVSDATGTSFADAAEELVLAPLEMRDSTFRQPLLEALHARGAAGHDAGGPVEGGWREAPAAGGYDVAHGAIAAAAA